MNRSLVSELPPGSGARGARAGRGSQLSDRDVRTVTAAIHRGDRAAFARFYDAWFDAAFVLARTVTRRDESFCLDVVQSVMMKVVDSLPRLDSAASLRQWMARVIHNAAIDRIRAETRRAEREREAATERPDRDAADPRGDLILAEDLEWVRRRVAELPEAERALVEYRFGDGLTLAETGRILGMTGNSVHSKLRGILAKLRWKAGEGK